MLRIFFSAVVAWFAVCAAPALADPPPLSAYGQLPQVETMSLSPSGNRVAAVAVAAEKRRLIVRDETNGQILYASEVGDAKIRGVGWAGENFVLVTLSKTTGLGVEFNGGRYELSTILAIDLTAKKSRWVLGDGATPRAILAMHGVRKYKDHWVGYYKAFEYVGEPVKLYRYDFETGLSTDVADGSDKYHEDWVVNGDGKVVAREEYDDLTGEWRLMSLLNGRQVLMTVKSPLHDTALEGLGRTPDTVLISKPGDGGQVFEEVSLADGSVTPLGDAEPVTGEVRDRSGLLLGFDLQGEPGGRFFDPVRQARFVGARKAFPGRHMRLGSHTDDLGRMIVFTDAGDDSGTFWTVDVAHGSADVIGSAYPQVTSKDVGPTRMVAYKAADGLAMEGLLTLPPGREAKGLALVVMPHGGPVAPGDRPGFDWWAQAFASRGYAVFQPNFRGTDGYGPAFREAADGEWGAKMQTDISDGVAALASQGIVDANRACIVGASYGGYAALAGVSLQHGLYRCSVAVAPVTDLKAFINWERDRHGLGEIVRWWRHLMGVRADNDPVLRAVSPALQADKADAPVLLIHGADDTTVPIHQSQEMERALKAAGKPVEFVTLKGDDHHMSKSDTRLQMLEASVAFVLKNNPPN
jgi:dipeptidyl aminopeptidase/acylaminoacyl peptidase